MAEFGLVEPFEIDHGELDRLTPQECFCLGVEWQLFRSRLQSGRPFNDVVLDANAERLTKLAERAGRFVEARPAKDGWAEILVGGHTI